MTAIPVAREGRIDVAPNDWHRVVSGLLGDGFALFDVLTAIDRVDTLEVVARFVDPIAKASTMVWTSLPADAAELESLSDLYLGAAWCERETAEMFGVTFTGLADSRPLLLRAGLGDPPLRKASTLVARAVRDWPGAAEATDDGRKGGNPSRRRQLPPGVPEEFLRKLAAGADGTGSPQ